MKYIVPSQESFKLFARIHIHSIPKKMYFRALLPRPGIQNVQFLARRSQMIVGLLIASQRRLGS